MRHLLAVLVGLLLLLVVFVAVCYETVPTHNTDAQHFDVILVLGTPARQDGRPSKTGRWLVTEAVHEYLAGKAPRIVISGAAVANQFAEAGVLARLAQDMGVPADAIIEDTKAHDTLQNVSDTEAIMNAHGWSTVEVIGMPQHLPRAAVLLQHTSLRWRVHPAATPRINVFSRALHVCMEAFGTTVLRVFGLRAVPALHWVKSLFWRSNK